VKVFTAGVESTQHMESLNEVFKKYVDRETLLKELVEVIESELNKKVLLRLFLLFKGIKSLYFTYSIVNFTALNLQEITSLHLLTIRVKLLKLLKSVRLSLQTTGIT